MPFLQSFPYSFLSNWVPPATPSPTDSLECQAQRSRRSSLSRS